MSLIFFVAVATVVLTGAGASVLAASSRGMSRAWGRRRAVRLYEREIPQPAVEYTVHPWTCSGCGATFATEEGLYFHAETSGQLESEVPA